MLGGGSAETPLTSDGGQNVQPAWSPDGKLIAYHSLRHGGIWVIAARGGTPKQLTTIGARPAWSPDGRRIAYQSDEHGDVGAQRLQRAGRLDDLGRRCGRRQRARGDHAR